MDKARKCIQELCILVDLEYKNGFSISVDCDLIFGRSAYVHIKIASIVGKARLQFTRHPFTHWNFAFVEVN
jgi:PDZ domain-containing protein 8